MQSTIWWQYGILYEVYPRSFQDANGDGIGDLRGILQRLDYLAELGIKAVWIAPFYPSPMADFGYDVADYWQLSGLTNCGYSPEEAASLAPVWAPRLNEWHLFDNPDDAEAYADVTEKRVPEHAPFYAYGIYQLR